MEEPPLLLELDPPEEEVVPLEEPLPPDDPPEPEPLAPPSSPLDGSFELLFAVLNPPPPELLLLQPNAAALASAQIPTYLAIFIGASSGRRISGLDSNTDDGWSSNAEREVGHAWCTPRAQHHEGRPARGDARFHRSERIAKRARV
jgi:hypothetical protein